ncbi:MAG: formate dehydrogenase accessory sulfurtransferase FdhD [Helicobacteraceae bacterium]|nr:formate dehydrogenase accessory sulfurtransferase FdhD [Helicobacteraceae bacterium]
MIDVQKQTICVPIIKINDNGIANTNDTIVKEDRVNIYLNGSKIISTMCILKDQDFHSIGFLMSEGVIENVDDIKDIEISKDGLNVYINAKINDDNISNLFHEKTLTSGCCVGVSANFEGKIIEKFLSQKVEFHLEQIRHYISEFQKNTDLFSNTGCTHKAMLFCDDKSFLSEDIGRHNAIDKVLGKAQILKIDTSKSLLIVSGRLSMEMVIKCAMHNVPVVISNAATTALGIKSAQNLGITLIGFARNGNMNIYTHGNRIILPQG